MLYRRDTNPTFRKAKPEGPRGKLNSGRQFHDSAALIRLIDSHEQLTREARDAIRDDLAAKQLAGGITPEEYDQLRAIRLLELRVK